MSKKITTKICVEKFQKIHQNMYDYSLVEYVGARQKVQIICIKHGLFLQRPNCHLQGHGCPSCGSIQGNKLKIKIEKETINPKTGLSKFQERYEKIHKTRKEKNNYNDNISKVVKKYKKEFVNGVSKFDLMIQKGIQTKIEKGYYNKPIDYKSYKRYMRKVRRITKQNIENLLLEEVGKEIDHIVSIFFGFKNKVDVEIISHVCNLQLVSVSLNRKKGMRSHLSIKELDSLIKDFDQNNTFWQNRRTIMIQNNIDNANASTGKTHP